jgi:hypothetical protein
MILLPDGYGINQTIKGNFPYLKVYSSSKKMNDE